MDWSLPDIDKVTVPVPAVEVMTEERNKGLDMSKVTHYVVQLSDRRFNCLMQAMAGVPFDRDSPWGFWFFIGKVVSKAFFNDERRLKWFNSVRISTRAFIGFADTAVSFDEKEDAQNGALYILELDFLKPRPRESIKLFWKPARPPI
ncbi:hypothetical protein ACQRIU_005082 [Beauveria bassiana]